MTKILIYGSNGWIGSQFTKLLEEKNIEYSSGNSRVDNLKDVVDVDNPQWKLGLINMSDPQALRDPRPDGGYHQSRELYAWNPVGGGNTAMGSRTVGLDCSGHVGRVEVEIT